MLRNLIRIPAIFICFTLLMTLQKIIFMLFVGGYSPSDVLPVMWHGLSMDMSMAGYLTAPAALLAIANVWYEKKWITVTASAYMIVMSVVVAVACVVNCILYPVWKFPLDATPIFYVSTSPVAAAASATFGEIFMEAISTILITSVCSYVLIKVWRVTASRCHQRKAAMALMMVELGLLFLPIRGGVTVSTMNPGRAYFSTDLRLNHAAINPLFNFMYSLLHQGHFDKSFRYIDDTAATNIMQELYPGKAQWAQAMESDKHSDGGRLPYAPDVHIIILESFSASLLPSMGGEPIAMRIDSIAASGLLFSNIYATSFRTDRSLPAILNGYPGLPTTTLSKYVDKLAHIPALARSMSEVGYEPTFYYGGDINFSNQRALLIAGGFDNIISDTDFPISDKMSKWGAHDHVLVEKVLDSEKDALASDPALRRPRLTVVQTQSSHEPFEVPYASGAKDIRVNAFMYTDSCVGAYVKALEASLAWRHSLVVLVPDHYGAYPELDDPIARHHIPLIITGGAIADLDIDPELLGRIGSQTDIAATLLGILGIDSSDFPFSADLLDPSRRQFAFFSEPSWIAMLTPEGIARLSVPASKQLGNASDDVSLTLKAYIQKLYDDVNAR